MKDTAESRQTETLVVAPPGESPEAGMTAPRPTVAAGATARRHRFRRPAWVRDLPWRTVLIVAGVLLAGLAFGVLQGYVRGRVPFRVEADGVPLGGLTRPQAAERVRSHVAETRLDSVTLRTPDGPLVLSLDRLGLAIDARATASRAAYRGRLAVAGMHLWYGGAGSVQPVVRFDQAAYLRGVEALRPAIEVAAMDARLRLEGGVVSVVPGRDGVVIDEVALQRAIVEDLAGWKRFDGDIPTMPAPPRVGLDEARLAAEEAEVYLSAPLRLRYRSRLVELPPSQLADMLSVNGGSDAADYPLTFDNARSRATLRRIFGDVGPPAVNARVVLEGTNVVIKPSREGFGIDMPRLIADMDDAASKPGMRDVIVSVAVLRPSRTTEELQELGLSGLGSEFTTFYDPDNTSRAGNIAQAAKLVDGAVIRPGQVFSLNAEMGPRTTDRGFDYAPVIVDGVLRQGVGGGICQFATTLFNAAFFAGLPIVERHPHDFYIDHYPVGRDAAVAWGSKDLKFRNDSGRTLMIRCWASGGRLTVVLVGDTGRTVEYTTSGFLNVRKSPHGKDDPRIVYDSDSPSGVVSWEKGHDGMTVKVNRTVLEGSRVVRRDSFISTYAPKDWIKRIGTG